MGGCKKTQLNFPQWTTTGNEIFIMGSSYGDKETVLWYWRVWLMIF